MSSLYQDPTELQKKLGRNKTGNFLQDGFTDWVSGGLSIGPDGKVKREGAAWWLQGLTPGAKGIAETQEAIRKNDQVRALVRDAPVDEGAILKAADGATITPDNIGGFIKKATLNYQTPAEIEAQKVTAGKLRIAEEQQRAATDAQKASNTLAQQQLALSRETQRFQEEMAAENNRNRWQDRKDQREERLLTRQLAAQTSADNLQLEYARLSQQDKRDARDRKDRAIMQLLAGLGNLGAAFTI